MKNLIGLFTLIITLSINVNALTFSNGTSININLNDINTLLKGNDLQGKSLNPLILEKLNQKIRRQKITIDGNTIGMSYTNPDISNQSGGGRCPDTTTYSNINGKVNLLNNNTLAFNIQSLNEVSSADIALRGELNLNFDIAYRKEKRIFRKCRRIFSTHGTVVASIPFDISVNGKLTFTHRELDIVSNNIMKKVLLIDPALQLKGSINSNVKGRKVTVNINNVSSKIDKLLSREADNYVTRKIPGLKIKFQEAIEKLQNAENIKLIESPVNFPEGVDYNVLKQVIFGINTTNIPNELITDNYNELLIMLLSNDNKGVKRLIASGYGCEMLYKDFRKPLKINTIDPAKFYTTEFGSFCQSTLDKRKFGNGNFVDAGKNDLWTLNPAQTLDLSLLSIAGRTQPYMQKAVYKTTPSANNQAPNPKACKLEMRIYKNDISATGLKPLIAIHGGGWSNRGFSYPGMESQFAHYTDKGYIVFAPFYRLTGNNDGNVECQNATYAEITADIQSAFEWIDQASTRNKYGISLTEQISLTGQSAGAHLAGWLATESVNLDKIDKALLFYPATDFGGILKMVNNNDPRVNHPEFQTGLTHLSAFANKTIAELKANHRLPVITRNSFPEIIKNDPLIYPDFFIVHGSDDNMVPFEQAVNLCNALPGSQAIPLTKPSKTTVYPCDDSNGKSSKLTLIKNAGHILDYCPYGICEPGNSKARRTVRITLQDGLNWLNYNPQL